MRLSGAMVLLVLALVTTGCAIPVEHTHALKLPFSGLPTCPKLAPIPAKMRIELDGQYIDTDAEGERFLRAYVASRDCYRGVK